jgi:hypothetical protein
MQSPTLEPTHARTRMSAHAPLVLMVLVVAAVGVAWWMTGPSPKGVNDGLPKQPPPLALPSDTPARSDLGQAAARLATGQLTSASKRFTTLVARDPNDVVAQTGLILSRWQSTGPRSVERDLNQLTKEYPEDAFPAAHLGFVQMMLGEERQARATLRAARGAAWQAGSTTDLRLARLADDMLHQAAFRGYLPVLVHADEVRPADQRDLTALLRAVERDDRIAAARLSRTLRASPDAMSRVAGVAGAFTKDDSDVTASDLRRMATASSGDATVRNRARLLAGLADMWGGGSRASGCRLIRSAATRTSDIATRRAALPIASELCPSN